MAKNLLSGLKLGDGSVHISIQQFVDDTLIFMEPTLLDVLTLKCTLRCFEVVAEGEFPPEL